MARPGSIAAFVVTRLSAGDMPAMAKTTKTA